MKRYRAVLLLALLLALPVSAACGENREPEGTADTESRETGEKDEDSRTEEASGEVPETYTFVDVEGTTYEAVLEEELASCRWDYSRLTREGEFLYYKDTEGNTLSRLGVDVSRYQGEIDWQQVREAGVEFAIIRLGFRGYGEEGRLVLDEKFEQSIRQAAQAGLDCGVYFFSQAVSEEEAGQEAEFVLEHLKGLEIHGPVVFDTEEIKDDVARTDGLTGEARTRFCQVFCDRIREAGYSPMIYANMKWMAFTLNLEELEDYEKWYADYEPLPQNPYDFTIWQYTETGRVPGIEGNVDLNIWFDREGQEKS